MSAFPVGGPREPVFQFLRGHGFVMSKWSDKHWTRADGLSLHVYGAGSKALIYDNDGQLITDDAIDTAIAKIEERK